MTATDKGQKGGKASTGCRRKAVVIAGPTASGKSQLAADLAGAFDGVVINADSMQVYQGLAVLTAQPSPRVQAAVPHRLYGVLPPTEACSMGRWLEMAVQASETAWAEDRLPIIVGGTGLYLRALMEGVAPVPDVPDAVRAEARALLAADGNEAFHRRLSAADPVMGGRLHPSNSQRLARAWEVLAATGRSLASWQEGAAQGGLDADIFPLLIDPPSAALRDACDGRFLAMMEQGALDETKALAALELDPALPAMKALGVPELMAFLRGEMVLDRAVADAQAATRRYAKRQRTWFRHQIRACHTIDTQYSERLSSEIFSIIRSFLLTASV